jgi:hypothetical protein
VTWLVLLDGAVVVAYRWQWVARIDAALLRSCGARAEARPA